MDNDVIVAIATPPGMGALSIIRLSGENVFNIVNTFFCGDVPSYKTHTAHFGRIKDANQSVIDEVILISMKGKKSFTGENSIEIICHGNPLITRKIIRRSIECGARVAQGGEFSKRAYSNGKIDLLQAEAIKEMIHAKNERALKEASKQLGGSLSIYIKELQQHFIDLLAIIEVHIDYPEEGIEESTKKELISMINSTKKKILLLIESFNEGKKIFSGYTIGIVGAPNAGKSSLLNALLDEDRVIVTDIEGTTRDIIKEELIIWGQSFQFIDTAGIHNAKNKIEKIGIQKSHKIINESDIVILLIDLTKKISDKILTIHNSHSHVITVYNKTDISQKRNPLNITNPIYISAKQKTGLKDLKEEIIKKTDIQQRDDLPIITKERHFGHLNKALQSLNNALLGITSENSIDLISFEIRDGLENLSEIIGINITEEILGGIFSKFCVGK